MFSQCAVHRDERPGRRSEGVKTGPGQSSLQPLLHWYSCLGFVAVTSGKDVIFKLLTTAFTSSLFLCTGATVVEWLISKEKARNRPEALMLATGLMNEGFLQPAGDLSKEGAESGEQAAFLDDTKALYYFVSQSE